MTSLLAALQILPITRLLPSKSGPRTLRDDLRKISSAASDDEFDFDRVQPLLTAALLDRGNDSHIWDTVYNAVTESTPPPRPITSLLQQTPWRRNTSSFANSEYRKYVDAVLEEELGPLYAGLRGFHDAYFGHVEGLAIAAEAVFKSCIESSQPLFRNGWIGWPPEAQENDVLDWLEKVTDQISQLAQDYRPAQVQRRRPIAQPNQPLKGSTAKRMLDIGFVNSSETDRDGKCHWSQILVPGELKSNPSADTASEAWLDLGRCAREVFAAQDTRRFVIGFTVCGSLMRIWVFDRLGGIASEQSDINKDGLRFVRTILGFLWMNEEQLGFDPTIVTSGDKRYIEIQRDGNQERLIIDGVMRRARCISGRATTCWKVHREGDIQTPLVIKDTWQYTGRDEEGDLLLQATKLGVSNVGRYYHHYTVQVLGTEDDVRDNVRKGLDITKAESFGLRHLVVSPSASAGSTPRAGRSAGSRKRSASHTDVSLPLPPSKRSCSVSPTKRNSSELPTRIHRRVILRDYGKSIYEASSPASLLTALEGCIEGHESLFKAGFLHRDISVNNLMINEDDNNPSWPAFLIDLDLAIKNGREGVSGSKGNTGTRAFMAIGVLYKEQHSFMHDLESFFWVLFWICVHYNGPGIDIGPTRFENWNYESDKKLIGSKKGVIDDEADFLGLMEESCTAYYRPLIPCVNKLRRAVFPDGKRWRQSNPNLYVTMREILCLASKDPKVLVDR